MCLPGGTGRHGRHTASCSPGHRPRTIRAATAAVVQVKKVVQKRLIGPYTDEAAPPAAPPALLLARLCALSLEQWTTPHAYAGQRGTQ